MPYSELVNRYEEHLKIRNYSPLTIDRYVKDTRIFLLYLTDTEGIERIQDATKDILWKYQNKIFAQKKLKDSSPLSLGTKAAKLEAVRSFFRFLSKKQEILYNPAADMELPRLRRDRLHDCLKETEVKKILKSPESGNPLALRNRAILELFYSTGIRNSELRFIEVGDIDFERLELKIKHAKGYFGEKERVIPVGKLAATYAQDYLLYSRPKLLKGKPHAVFFVTKSGKPLRIEDPADIVRRVAKDTGLKRRVYPHLFRHSFATHLLRRGADIRYVQAMLGHESLDTTKVYTKVEISDLKRVHHKSHPRERL